MKKESIYKLIEAGYSYDPDTWERAVLNFAIELNNQEYFYMSDYVKGIHFKHGRVSFSNKTVTIKNDEEN